MAYTIQDDTDTTSLGNVQSETIAGGSNLAPIALPDEDPSNAILIPTQGAVNEITIDGIYVGSLAEIKTFTTKLRKWKADGGKLSVSNLTYSSDLHDSTFSVRVSNNSYEWVAGDPNKIRYTLQMVEGTF